MSGFKPKEVPNWDDNYTGYDYGNHTEDFLRDALGQMDDLNLPISLRYTKDGIQRGGQTYPMVSLRRFLPRHGVPVAIVTYGSGATPEVFDRIARKILDFYGHKAVQVHEWGEPGSREELTVRLGQDAFRDLPDMKAMDKGLRRTYRPRGSDRATSSTSST